MCSSGLLPSAPERYRDIIATAAGAALRWGEAAELCLDAVDLGARRLEVIRTVVEVSGHTAFKEYPKSAAGRRIIPLPSWLIEIIAHHVSVYSSGVEQLVFPNTVGMPLRRTLFRVRVWKPTLVRSGLDPTLRFHDLWHCYATWCGRRCTDQHGAVSLRSRTIRNYSGPLHSSQ